MQDERKEDVEETEDVQAHKRFGPEDAEQVANRSDTNEESDDEVEAHRFRTGPEEFGKRF
jgi:hypothetical protein